MTPPAFPPTAPPYEHAGDIQQGTLPPDLDAAYRGAYWTARTVNGILAAAVPTGVPYSNRAIVRANGKGKIVRLPTTISDSYGDAPAHLILMLREWLRPVGYAVRDVADKIALARGKSRPLRINGLISTTWHELAILHAESVLGALYGALTKAARLPSVTTVEEPNYRQLFGEHWNAIAPALADVPQLGEEFRSALKLESLRAMEYRQKRQQAHDAPASAVDAPSAESTKRKKGRGGRPRLEDSKDCKARSRAKLYEIVRAERKPDDQLSDVVRRLREKDDVVRLAQECGVTINKKLIRSANEQAKQRERRSAIEQANKPTN